MIGVDFEIESLWVIIGLAILAILGLGVMEMYILSYLVGVKFDYLVALFLGLTSVALTSGRS